MSKKVPSTKKKIKGKSYTLSQEDADLLASFCDGIEFEDIPLEKWSNANKSLDIELPVYISKKEAEDGGERRLQYSQTIFTKSKGKNSYSTCKKKLFKMVEWKCGVVSGTVLTCENEGDIRDDLQGTLFIRLLVKKDP